MNIYSILSLLDELKKKKKKEEELVEPVLDKAQLSIVKSVIREIKEFNDLSNSARMDIAEKLVAKEYTHNEIIMNKNVNTAHVYVLIR